MIKPFILFLLSLLPSNAIGSIEETTLRKLLFKDHNTYVRPVAQPNNTMSVTIGMAVQNIESFNQIEETMKLNVWLRKYWKNDILKWNPNTTGLTQLTLDESETWTPDVELLNAATKPDLYTLKGGMYLYSDGSMLWSMPAIYKFSCSLELQRFPFDTQDCFMRFGSWSYDNYMLSLKPHGDANTQIDVLDSFSHSEWSLVDYYVTNTNETRACCGNRRFDINEYHFKFKRYTHYYKLNMGMTIALVIVSFIIMLVKPDNLSRTGTAVFIPLTILALELTIAGKIPVVGYFTLMDQFFLTCFITSMIVSIESGIVFALITSKTTPIFKVFDKCVDYKKILKRLRNDLIKRQHELDKHNTYIVNKKTQLFPIINRNNGSNSELGLADKTNSSTKRISNTKRFPKFIETNLDNLEMNIVSKVVEKSNDCADEEFDTVTNALHNYTDSKEKYADKINGSKHCVDGCCGNDKGESCLPETTNIYKVHPIEPTAKTTAKTNIDNAKTNAKITTKTNAKITTKTNTKTNTKTTIDNANKSVIGNNDILDKDIFKTINFDDQNLSLSYKEYILFNEVSRIFTIVDNGFRVVLPLIFFIMMAVIFSYEQ